LTAHYRSKLNYSEESIEGARISLNKLRDKINELSLFSGPKNPELKEIYTKKFLDYINNDLDMPKALALVWDIIKDDHISDKEKYDLILDFDKVFSLNLKQEKIEVPEEVISLANEREVYRKEKNFEKSDEIRKIIENKGYTIKDEEGGFLIKKGEH
ncbi:MAG: cysteine--tRNA ligase, partial [Candidatus Pacebacteria bacterium]|nr:cysteine--tRNA ligase [Candidatus Paceibacterota bacterium]